MYHQYLLNGGAPKTGTLPGARRLTVCESAILQTFPAHTIFYGSQSSQYQQIGNAVPPTLAQILGKSLVEQLRNKGTVSFHILPQVRTVQHILFSEEHTSFMSKVKRNEAVERAVKRTLDRIDAFINTESVILPNPKYRKAVDVVVSKKSASVRTMLLFLMFYRLEDSSWDLSSVPVGARGQYGDKRLCEALTLRSITLHNNIVAWGENLGTKGGVRTFDLKRDARFKDFIEAIEDAFEDEQTKIADYMAYTFAASRKVIAPLPPLSSDLLTFVRAKSLFYQLLSLQTEGHVQQFLVAALLEIFRFKQSIEVRTHHPHASDKFDNTAGDIEEYVQHKLLRAYEVTMRDDWQHRISSFTQKMQRFNLEKYIIIANNVNSDRRWSEPAHLALSLEGYRQDIAVIDIQDVVNFFAAELSAEELRESINRTYELLSNPKLSGRHEFLEAYRSVVGAWLDDVSNN